MQILRDYSWNLQHVFSQSRMTGILQVIDREKTLVFKRVVIYDVFPNVYISR